MCMYTQLNGELLVVLLDLLFCTRVAETEDLKGVIDGLTFWPWCLSDDDAETGKEDPSEKQGDDPGIKPVRPALCPSLCPFMS